MDFNFLNNISRIKILKSYEKKNSWLQWLSLRRRKPNSEEEINEIHDLILNVYESIDDQARAVLLSLAKIIQDEARSMPIEEKAKAIIAMGHTLCCTHMQVKNSLQLYSNLLIRALSHPDLRLRLAAMIAIAETAIDNLSFQIKLNEIGIIQKLFEIMKTSMTQAGCTLNDINEHSKLVAWSCYTIVNICTNCMPNILLLKDIVPLELETLNNAVQMEIWRYIWRENYAKTIVDFANHELTSDIINNATQPKPYLFENFHNYTEQSPNMNAENRTFFSINYQRCTIL